MRILCISASNVEQARDRSASTRTCELIHELIKTECEAQVEILRLLDYEMIPCRMCGQCYTTGKCEHDEHFNQIYQKLADADALFVVCPHYAPLPSKLMMLLEKLEEICYLNWCQDQKYKTIVFQKPIGLVAHGGQPTKSANYYKTALLDPLALAFSSVQMKVVGSDEQSPNGVVFGVKNLHLVPDSIFVEIEHDWNDIRSRLSPLVKNVVGQIHG
jgi:multimeric flavodoxin WrbA